MVKVIGALYKIPLTALIGEVGRGYFNAAYEIYTPLYAISMAGLPVTVSKMVSQERALGHHRDVKVIVRTARRIFLLTGLIATVLLFAIAYRWISKLTYCANPLGNKDDFIPYIIKNFNEPLSWRGSVESTIQLAYNDLMERPKPRSSEAVLYFSTGIVEPEVPF